MRTFDGLDLHVRVHGPQDAPLTVALAHCWTADTDDWHYQVQALLDRYGHGIRVLTWDHRGHGRSDPSPLAGCTIANLGRDMGDLLDRHAPTGPLVLAGHSIGGMTIMALAEQRPDLVARVRGLLLCSTAANGLDSITLGLPEPSPAVKSQIPRLLAVRARMLSRRHRRRTPTVERWIVQKFLFGEPLRARDAGLVVDQVISCPPETMRGFYEDFSQHDRLAALQAYDGRPVTVLVGERDLLTPPAYARRMAAAVDSARLVIAPAAGHMLPLERDELVSAELVALVDQALGEGTRHGA